MNSNKSTQIRQNQINQPTQLTDYLGVTRWGWGGQGVGWEGRDIKKTCAKNVSTLSLYQCFRYNRFVMSCIYI